MHICCIMEVEDADELSDYDRIKIDIAFDSNEECRKVWQAIKDHNKEVEESYWEKFDPINDLRVIAYLHYNHKTNTVTVENNLLSAYFDGEWDFPNSWLKPHAFERCKEFVAEIYKQYSLENLYHVYGLYSTFECAKDHAEKVKELYYKDKKFA